MSSNDVRSAQESRCMQRWGAQDREPQSLCGRVREDLLSQLPGNSVGGKGGGHEEPRIQRPGAVTE